MKEKTKDSILNKEKIGIVESFRLLWKFMGKKERLTFIVIIFVSLISALTQAYGAMLPALIVGCFTKENISILGFLSSLNLEVYWLVLIICLIEVLLWVIGMLNYRMIDIFGRKMMCVVNERAQDIILLERKNLDLGMTVGEASYIVKSAVDNIYHIIEPFCWNFLVNIVCVVYLTIELFLLSPIVGAIEIGLVLIILICVYLRTRFQQPVVEKIEETNAKIGNHFLQSLTNLPMITIFESKARELSELKKLNSKFFKDNKKRANIGYVYWTVVISIEYLGLAGLVIAYCLTNGTANIAAAVTLIINEIMMVYTMVENWGYLLSDMQTSAIKFCNLKKVYPENYFLKQKETQENEKVSAKSKKIVEAIEKEGIKSVLVEKLLVKSGNFKKTYDIEFKSGNVYLISGQSGKGKTTLINAICGLRSASSGNIVINGKFNCKSLFQYKNHISYLFQDSILFDRSIVENIAYPEQELSPKAEELVKFFGIQKLLNRENCETVINTLSGGEKKRIDIIRTVSKDKDIYFLDEPTNELDSKNVENVLKVITELAEQDKIVIIVSHDDRCKNIASEIVEI